MIRTVTLNPAVDKRVVIEGFAVDKVNRVSSVGLDAGGKGINVSKAIAALGGRSVAYAIVAGGTGDYIRAWLEARGIEHRLVRASGETRTNLKVVDPKGCTHTDINEAGPRFDPAAIAALETLLFEGASPEDIFVFSGSAPEGCDPGIYATWIARAARAGSRALLDADGELLRRGAAAGPTLLKPNLHELERLAGRLLPDQASMIAAARELLGCGTRIVALSLGEEGAVFIEEGRAIRARGIEVTALSTVGAGDSMLAAIALSMEAGGDLEAMVVPAVAAGTAAVAAGGSAAFDAASTAAFASRISYETL